MGDDSVRSDSTKAGTHNVVRARRFELEDESGRVRATLACSDDGAPSCELLDATGKPRVQVSVADGKPGLRLLDSSGLARMSIILHEDTPSIEYTDADGTARMLLYLRPHDEESADLVFLGANGKPRLGLTTTKEGAILFEGEDELGRLVEPMWFSRVVAETTEPIH
ncbi:MAG: hypothetical protein GIW99_04755 [Candidatus Eremiobacteraeota bacterium]|nr:hypothetical protein [Candidatus Eremiobacteraeota bacterium]MBC5826974.1 hypothetical protein [Candidatus Eremiobacteraeota bacterium]